MFTLHKIHGREVTLGRMEEAGFGAGEFWSRLCFNRPPGSYHDARWAVSVQMLTSGILAADHVNTVSPGSLEELAHGVHPGIPASIRAEILHKQAAGRASGVLSAPDSTFNPAIDPALDQAMAFHALPARFTQNYLAPYQKLLGRPLVPETRSPLPVHLSPLRKSIPIPAAARRRFPPRSRGSLPAA